ncbi:MAG: GNAT family N-acetyltransferase [Micromonosporaceae bacterium]|nr:GNAT family N-acetyltransferase [Micromonosporaceae bacterium]
MTLVRWTGDDVVRRLDDVLQVYAEAMDYSPDLAATRRGFVYAHTHRPGFRAVATLADDDQLLGFGYGYTSERGQWWHEQVRAGLSSAAYTEWLTDALEVVELHMRPDAQGHGLGERQLVAMLDGAAEAKAVLSTPEAPYEKSRAWRLYRKLGFADVLRDFHFPGDERPFGVLGRALPLRPR